MVVIQQESAESLLRIGAEEKPDHLNLLLASFNPNSIYAGMTSALTTGVTLAESLNIPLRLLVVRPGGVSSHIAVAHVLEQLEEILGRRPNVPVSIVSESQLANLTVSPTDYWLATFWSTAYALGRLVDTGKADRQRVTYLVQDFEPGFYPWSDDYVNALATYTYGFHLLINSAPLAKFLSDRVGCQIHSELVFAPLIDDRALAAAAEQWRPDGDRIRLLMYGRPSHPRNLFGGAVEGISRWVDSLPQRMVDRLVLDSAGGEHDDIDLGRGVVLHSLGKLTYAEYYEQLSKTDIGLALMYSPHPGHLALEMPMAGIPTVTNRLLNYREVWVSDLDICEARPDAISEALERAAESARARTTHSPGERLCALGVPLESAVAALTRRLKQHPLEILQGDPGVDVSDAFRLADLVSRGDLLDALAARDASEQALEEARAELEHQAELAAQYAGVAKDRAVQVTQLMAKSVSLEADLARKPNEDAAQLRRRLEKQMAITNRTTVRLALRLVRPLEGAYAKLRQLRQNTPPSRKQTRGTGTNG